MQKKLFQILLTFACCTFATIAAAADHSIHIEWGYTPPSEPAVTGYRLYQEGAFSCETQNPLATSMDCSVSLTQDTTNFTLTALFSDSSESPHSTPFPFTVAGETTPPDSPPVPEPDTSGSHAFTFTWDSGTTTDTISEHRVYLNGDLLCASNLPTATNLTCNADLINGLMTFSMTTVDNNGIESAPSNILTFDPTAYPNLFNPKQVAFSWEYPDTMNLAGFKIYQNNSFLCETINPETRTLTCTANFTSSTNTFAIAAVDVNGTETTLSNTLTYTKESAPVITQIQAAITVNANEGTAPLTIAFDASSSTGDITSHSWSFGDGETADANNINHTFNLPGSYTAKLTITDSNGSTSSDTTTITVTEAVVANTPPIAAITTPSGTTGEAPLTITFDGSGSSDSDGTISSYTWNFGDGSSMTGKQVNHTFSDAGTFTASLLVTDDQGLTSTTSIPIIATAPVQETNQPPVAAISTTTSTGKTPLTVSFSASSSTDPDGTIENYTWNFGDGYSASGTSATHTYTTEADYIATLQVTDDKGMTSTASTTITVDPAEENAPFAIEIGEIIVNSTWKRVDLEKAFSDPVIIAGPPSFNGSDPGIIRLRNIDPTGFEIKFAEWDYLDGNHADETVSYLALEKGHHNVDGTFIEAGTSTGTTSFKANSFQEAFNEAPIVMTTIATENEARSISGRVRKITASGFNYYFREQELDTNTHANETVNYIAWQPGSGVIESINFEAGKTADAVTHAWHDITYQAAGDQLPFLFADMQTTDGGDTSAVRIQSSTKTGLQVKVEEEQSKDDEVSHTTEVIGYLALTSNEQPESTTKLVTFNWEIPTELESTTFSFRMYVNSVAICEQSDVLSRSISCEVGQADTYTFEMTAVTLTGEETSLSNQLQLAQ